MSWEHILSEDDYRLYKQNITLLEDRIISNFADSYKDASIISAVRNVPRHFFVNGRQTGSLLERHISPSPAARCVYSYKAILREPYSGPTQTMTPAVRFRF